MFVCIHKMEFHESQRPSFNSSVPTLKKLQESYPEKEVMIIGVFNNFWMQQLKKGGLWDGQDLPFRDPNGCDYSSRIAVGRFDPQWLEW